MKVRDTVLREIKKNLKKIYVPYYLMCIRGAIQAFRYIYRKEKVYFVSSHGIGDIVWLCAYAANFRKENIKEIILITENHSIKMAECFRVFDRIIGLNRKDLMALGYFSSSSFNKNKNLIHGIYPKLRKNQQEFTDECRLLACLHMEMYHAYKYGCLKLSRTAQIKLPEIRKADFEFYHYINKNKEMENRTIVLMPYVNSRHPIPWTTWSCIASALKKRGFYVLTNVKNEAELILPGSEALMVPLEYLPTAINYYGYCISARCGAADWLFLAQSNLTVLHYVKGDDKEEALNLFAQVESFLNISKECNIHYKRYLQEYYLEDRLLDMIPEILAEEVYQVLVTKSL